jgi:hypothetical protein
MTTPHPKFDTWLLEEDIYRIGLVIEGKLALEYASLDEIEEYERVVVAIGQARRYH